MSTEVAELPDALEQLSPSIENLSPAQDSALRALLNAPNCEAAAQVAGISPKTLWRYLKQPEFLDAYRQARREAVNQSVAQLQRLSSDAVLALGAVARDEAAPATARVAAAKAIMDLSLRAVEMDDVSGRLEAMEQMFGNFDFADRS